MKEKQLILAVETSAAPVSCALIQCEGDNLDTLKVLSASMATTPLPHSKTLLPMVHSTFENAGISPKEVTAVAVAHGPGSFTGVRIGVSAVKGIAFTNNLPCIGVSTLEAMAFMWHCGGFEGLIVPVMDARCSQIYTAVFESDGHNVMRLREDMAIRQEEMLQYLQQQQRSVLLVGDGADLCYSLWKEHCPQLRVAGPMQHYQQAVGVAIAAVAGSGQACSAERLQPVYLRLPQAERELKARTAKSEG